MMSLYPFAAAMKASPMPVLPLVVDTELIQEPADSNLDQLSKTRVQKAQTFKKRITWAMSGVT
ncbi:hypothetical protein HanPSC8_Chr10g0425041 [Helianthus annuus]|nr:hypothetical protein HanPSC8_Chr10g0425041 [Helianthus annuus]